MKQIVLLRGVNVGGRNRVPMPALREALEAAGLEQVATYLQSGNVVLDSAAPSPPRSRAKSKPRSPTRSTSMSPSSCARAPSLRRSFEHDPLGELADQAKLYQVSFCSSKPAKEAVGKARRARRRGRARAVHGREIYAWFPHGVGRSKLAAQLSKQKLGMTVTARNWTTVKKLLELAGE